MGYSINDLKNAANTVNERLERRSQERGEALANHLMNRTQQGRGLWFIVLWPAWLLIFVFYSVFLVGLTEKFGIHAPLSWLGVLGGFLFVRAWYASEFTLRHPFWGSMFGYFGTALAVVFMAGKLGIAL
ncbi:MAG: hypothetical protein WA056_11410 [Gallionella sp.]